MAESAFAQNNYLNVVINNDSKNTTLVPAIYSQQLTQPYLRKADEWKMSIIRFSLPVDSLPYFTASANTYYISLSWRAANYTGAIPVTSFSSINSSAVYFINQWLDSVNGVLRTLYQSVITANPSDAMLYAGHSPYFQFDSATQLISLVTDAGTWDTGTATFLPGIFCNTALSNLFSGIPQRLIAYNSVSHLDSQFQIVKRPNNITVQPLQPFATSNQTYAKNAGSETSFTSTAIPFALPVGAVLQDQNSSVLYQNITLTAAAASGATALTVAAFVPNFAIAPGDNLAWLPPPLTSTRDEVSSAAAWFNAFSVVVQSRQLPARPENLPASTLMGASQNAMTNTLSQQSIVSDFLFPSEDRISGSTSLIYLPSAQYRYVDLISDGAISFIDLSFYWSDFAGNLTLIQLQPGQTASCKLIFERKHQHVVVEKMAGGDLTRDTFSDIRDEHNGKRKRLA